LTYKAVHRLLRKLRGPANDKFCSAPRCDRVADEWALDVVAAERRLQYDEGSRPYSSNLDDYMPLCRPCHRKCDGNYRA
jgi:hypothetical protein